MRYKVSKLANNRSLIDITYNTELKNFQIDIVEFGSGGTGSKSNTSFYMKTDQMSLISDDIVNTRFKNNWENGFKLYLVGGKTTARDIQFSFIKRKTDEKLLILVHIRNGEAAKGMKGGTQFKKGSDIKQAMTQQTLYDMRKMMKTVQDFIHQIKIEDRFELVEYKKNPGE